MTDPVVKTIAHAKELSLKKWHKSRKLLEALLEHTSQPCGFCHYSGGCIECEVLNKCHELTIQVNVFLEGSLNYIEQDLIPYLEKFQLNGGSQ